MGAIFFVTYVLYVLIFLYVLGFILDMVIQKKSKKEKVDIKIYELEKSSGKYKRVK